VALPEFRWARAELNDRARRTALSMLSPAETGRYETAADALHFLAGRLVLRGLVGDLLGTTPDAVALVARCPDCGGPHGRPELPDSPLHVSLSHGAGVVVAAASWDGPIGIDIESPDVPPERLAAIEALTGEASVLRWARVEAVLKADGRGLRVDPSRVSFDLVGTEARIDDSATRYGLSEVDLAPGLRVSVAIAE
jgi:4'-phosphopantetheinyl transferase